MFRQRRPRVCARTEWGWGIPIGQRVTLLGHFREPVVVEAVRLIGAGYECSRAHLPMQTKL